MRIAIGSDHAGFRYKERIKKILARWGHDVTDFGTDSEESVDYPKFIRPVALAVALGEYDRGIVLGGSGNGEAIVANRVPGVRCTLCWNVESARYARLHNDATTERSAALEQIARIAGFRLAATVSSPLGESKTTGDEGLSLRSSRITYAVASVAWPHRSTSSTGVNQRRW